jgi:hypothetical protein
MPPRPGSTLSDIHVARARALLAPLCAPHRDPSVNARLRYGYRFEGPAVVFFESRPHFITGEWFDHDIAKFRFTKTTGLWSLYCRFSDLKWRGYEPLPVSADLADLVAEVQRDPTCIFFG